MTINVKRRGARHVTCVESDKERDKEYEIAQLPDGSLACACMAYVFNKERPKTCKHIRAYELGCAIERSINDTALEMPRKAKIDTETFTFKRRAISFTPI